MSSGLNVSEIECSRDLLYANNYNWDYKGCDTKVQSVFKRLLEVPSSVVREVVTTFGKQVIATSKPGQDDDGYMVSQGYGTRLPGLGAEWRESSYGTVVPGYKKEYAEVHHQGRGGKDIVEKYHTNGYGEDFVVANRLEPCGGMGCNVPIGFKLERDDTGVRSVVHNSYDSWSKLFQPNLQCDIDRPQGPTTLGGVIVEGPHTVARCHGVFAWGPAPEEQSSYQSTEVIRADGGKAPYVETMRLGRELCQGRQCSVEKSGSKRAEDSLPLFDEWNNQDSARTEGFDKIWNAEEEADRFKAKFIRYAVAAASVAVSLYCFRRAYQSLSIPRKAAEGRLGRISRIAAWALAGTVSAASAGVCLSGRD